MMLWLLGVASMVSVLRWMPWGEGYQFFYVKKMTWPAIPPLPAVS